MSEARTLQSQLLIGSKTDPGRSGKNNEDTLDVFVVDWQDALKLQQVQVAVVADGIGGNNAGERASKIAVERIRSQMIADRTTPLPERLEKALTAANQDIYTASQYEASLRGMGTTVVAAAIVGSTLYVAHAGDSRAYIIRDGKIHRLTLDHTWAQEALEAGRLTPETARLHPNRNVIKRFLGVEETVDIDHNLVDIGAMPDADNPYTASARLDRLALQPGDRILLCSDGLNDELTDEEILSGAQKNPPQKAAEHLVAMANAKGGRDNISVVVLQLPGPQAAATVTGASKGRIAIFAAAAAVLLLVGAGAALLLSGGRSTVSTPVVTAEVTASGSPAAEAIPTEGGAAVAPTRTLLPPSTPSAAATVRETATSSTGAGAPDETATVDPGIPPTSTPLVLETPTPTATPTAASRPGGGPATGPATRPPATSPAASTDLRVTLLRPNNGDSGAGVVAFEWRLEGGALGPNQAMELVFWQEGQTAMENGKSPTGASDKARFDVDFAAQSALLPPGQYRWGVLLVQTSPSYSRIRLLSDERAFRVESSGGGEAPEPPKPSATPDDG